MESDKLLDLPEAETTVRLALLTEIGLLREQRKSYEDRIAKLEAQVGEMQSHVERLLASARDKDRENSRLWEQVRRATEEYRTELLARDTTIAALCTEGDTLRSHLREQMDIHDSSGSATSGFD
eukprot:jgi/Botrbrau1/16185/Bobra.0342s0003.1